MTRVHGLAILALAFVMGTPALSAHAGGAMNRAQQWRSQTSGTNVPLLDVSCFTAARCKVVGAQGTVLYTKNGGATWRPQKNPLQGDDRTLSRIVCVGLRTCYVLAPPATVLVTRNGGASWSDSEVPIATSHDPAAAGCSFAAASATSGRIGLCTSGLTGLACVNASTCYVTAAPSAIFETVDAGGSWTPQTIPLSVPCEGSCGTTTIPYKLEWVSCPTPNACYAGGSSFIGSHEGFATAVLTMTGAGNPWTEVRKGTLGFAPDDAVCPRAAHCIGIYNTSPFEKGTSVWRTDSGGLDWTALPGGSPHVRNAVACVDPSHCVSVGNQGSITFTTNGRSYIKAKSPTSRNLFGVHCVTVAVCYAVGNHGAIAALR